MAKKRKRTVKVEIPLPDISSPKINKKDLKKATKSFEQIHETMQKNTKLLALLAVISVAAALVHSMPGSVQVPAEEDNAPQFRTITEENIEVLSFSEYMENYQAYDGSVVTLKGMLSYKLESGSGQGTLGVYVYRLVDDLGNEIDLSGLDPQKRIMFLKGEVTEDVFEVSGTIDVGYQDFELVVDDITPSEREVTLTEKTDAI